MSKVPKKNLKLPIQNKPKLSTQKINELQTIRIMQKNLVYVIGLSAKIASSDVINYPYFIDSLTKGIFRPIRQNCPTDC